MQKVLLLLCFTLIGVESLSQTLSLPDTGRLVVNSSLQFLRDESDELTINDIQTADFQPVEGSKNPNFGFDRTTYWFRMDVVNNSYSTDWLLEINFSPLDRVDFFVQGDSTWIQKTTGDTFPIVARDIPHRHPLFTFTIPQKQSKTIYLRVKTTSSVQLPAIFWMRHVFARVSYHIQLINGLFYGAMLMMALYQLFLFFSLRDKITWYYLMTLIAMTNIISFFQGYNFLYFHPQKPMLNDVIAIVSGPLFIVCSTFLTRSFLNLRKFNRWLDYALLANMMLDVVAGVLMMIFFREISYKYHHYLSLSHAVLALLSAGYCLYKRYRPARYYLLAWIVPLLASASFTMSNLGFVSGLLSMNYAGLMIGSVLQALFISFALGDRWNMLEKENRLVKESELKRRQEENERLEHEVKIRTTEIQQQNLQLEEVNNVKDKLFSVVSHDIKGPLSSLHLALTLAKSGSLNEKEFQHISAELDTRLIQTTEFIDNLLQWAKLQMKGEAFEPGVIDLSQVVGETVRLLEPECKLKDIHLINSLQGQLDAFADVNMIRSVVRNLLTNAIKFTRSSGSITLNAYRVDKKIIISVADTGVGIPKRNCDRLFTLSSITTEGTGKEKGTGLGLLLCREFVEKNGGRIWFETEEGKGTTFYFSLSMYHEKLRSTQAHS